MDPSVIFSKYSALTAFFNKYKNVDINDFVAVIEAAHYALRLEGKTLEDINAAQTVRDMYPFAAALDISDSKHIKKHLLKQQLVDKYNTFFGASEEVEEEKEEEKKEEEKEEEKEEMREEEKKEEQEIQLDTYRYGHLFLQEQALFPKLSLHDFFQAVNFCSDKCSFMYSKRKNVQIFKMFAFLRTL